ncbi:MAG: hypothetical protein NXI20_16480 [bacterium]|nr:hypothetical protein [bacterium]
MTFNKAQSQVARNAIERIYINMRHLFIRGSYKPTGVSGSSLMSSLLTLKPEIYGVIDHPEKVELEGMLYILERLPDGIEECRFIKLTAREGIEEAGHEVIIPSKRRRNCYRIDEDRMYVEMTRGRSDIYDILTHLTFLYNEAEKIKNYCIDLKGEFTEDWKKLEEIVLKEEQGEEFDESKAMIYLSNVLGRTVSEVKETIEKFKASKVRNSLYRIAYWLGKRSIHDQELEEDREVSFSAKLREIIGQHIYGEQWATRIKNLLEKEGLIERPIHVISANLHSFMNIIYGFQAGGKFKDVMDLANATSAEGSDKLNDKIRKHALGNGMYELPDSSGTNLTVQVYDFAKIDVSGHPLDLTCEGGEKPVLIVMDYAFGEQAYECMEELLKPFGDEDKMYQDIRSITIMGKAGILEGDKGDLMIPTAHVFEGTADNYPFENLLTKEDFEGNDLGVYEGTMITVLGTSLQNRDVLNHFLTSTWNAVGLEMEGAHYQKAIQSSARIRRSIREDVKVLYAYYASDNPLKTGKTLASGSLGAEGVKPTYLISEKVLEKVFKI